MEFSPSSTFAEGPSFFFRDRGAPRPWARVSERSEATVFESESFTLTVRDGASSLDAGALEVAWRWGGRAGQWRPGDMDTQNLGGPFSSLDVLSREIVAEGVHEFDPLDGHDAHRCSTHEVHQALQRAILAGTGRFPVNGETQEELRRFAAGEPSRRLKRWPEGFHRALARVRRFPPGFLTRGGLTVIRDTGPLWDREKNWITPRPGGHVDITFIACGDDYRGTLGEIARLSGPPPLLPRFALGVWFSCYRRMGQRAFERLADSFDQHDLPLDMVVVDTDWHRGFWHGFDWNRRLFPDPPAFFAMLRERGIHCTFNVHPCHIPAGDSKAAEFRRRTGSTAPVLTEATASHPFFAGCFRADLMNPAEAEAYFDVFHRPVTEMGCDFWWIDGAMEHWDGREATAWLNHLYFEHVRGGSDRPVAFSRASGLGCHRTTLAFSGDTLSQWEVLGQAVEMTVRAANSLVVHWSHDIGGFAKGDPSWKQNRPPAELYLRWVQFGSLSPVMRFHSDHGVREPWRFGRRTLALAREALQLRMRLLPLFEALNREAHETGVGPWRPMCYDWPQEEEAFRRWRQAMIGDGLLFAPVIAPRGWVEVWFPPGRWMHFQTRAVTVGPCIKRWRAGPSEIPLFVREGWVLDLAPAARRSRDIP